MYARALIAGLSSTYHWIWSADECNLGGPLNLLYKELFKPIKTFPGCMPRKLEIIRSLMHSPHILFLDEPTLGLDPISRRRMWEYLVDVRVRGHTTVFLTTAHRRSSKAG